MDLELCCTQTIEIIEPWRLTHIHRMRQQILEHCFVSPSVSVAFVSLIYLPWKVLRTADSFHRLGASYTYDTESKASLHLAGVFLLQSTLYRGTRAVGWLGLFHALIRSLYGRRILSTSP